ncbi:Retrotransposon-derived protein PEG10, partial [Smittium culicis]
DTLKRSIASNMEEERQFRLPEPPKFPGRSEDPKNFLLKIKLQFSAKPITFESDERKILFFASYLSEEAASWFDQLLQENSPVLGNYESFLVEFNRIFFNPNLILANADALMKCSQGTRQVIEYSSEFRRLANTSKFNQAALVYLYQKGLHPTILDRLTMTETPEKLEELINIAVKIDQRVQERNLMAKDYTHINHPVPQYHTPSIQNNNSMDIDMITERRRGPLSEQEKDRRRINGLCLYCGKPGHIVADCRLKPKNSMGKAQTQ